MARFKADVAASQTDSALVAAKTGQRIRVTSAAVSCGGTPSTVLFTSKPGGGGTGISATINNSLVLPENPNGWFDTTTGEGLSVTTGAGSTTGIMVNYTFVTP